MPCAAVGGQIREKRFCSGREGGSVSGLACVSAPEGPPILSAPQRVALRPTVPKSYLTTTLLFPSNSCLYFKTTAPLFSAIPGQPGPCV